MNNNRKQKVYSMLDSITRTELENYILDNKYINTKTKELLELLDRVKANKEYSQSDKILNKLNNNFQQSLNNYYKFGMANIIAFVLECFYDKKYKIKDLQQYLKAIIDGDKELKEYVYDIMKDM